MKILDRGEEAPAEGAPRPRPRRRPAVIIGLTLILAGLLVVGYVGWEISGTTWVSKRKHERITAAIEEAWSEGQRRAAVDEGTATALVKIPRFGADYVVPVLEGTSDEVFAAGYGHFDYAAGPGEPGNYAIAAHRVTHGEPLRRMPELKTGDQIVIETKDTIYTYVLDTAGDDLAVDKSETWVTDSLPDNPDTGEPEPVQQPGQRLITLTTCAELFHTDDRLVAFGHLESTQRR